MANDEISTNQVNAVTDAMTDLNATINDNLGDLKKLDKTIDSTSTDAERSINKIIKGLRRMTKTLTPAIKEFDKFGEIADNTEAGIRSLGKSFEKAFIAGEKQGMVAMNVIARNGQALASASRQAQITSQRMSVLSDDFKKAKSKIDQTRETIIELKQQQIELNKKIKDTGIMTKEEGEALDILNISLVEQKTALLEAKKGTKSLAEQAMVLTENLKTQQEEVLRCNRELISSAEASRAANRELRIMGGGATAVSAAFENVIDTKFFEYLKKAGSLAFVAGGFAMLVKGLRQIADHAQATSRIALSLGDASEVGFDRMKKSADEAQGEISTLHDLSLGLGYSMDELSGAMNRVRSSIRMDKEGRLTSAALRDMTKEAAIFARVSGMELGDTINLLETRVKRYGMTSAQATASLAEMRTTIMQMTAGNKNNTLSMGEMVNIIEDASTASQSYIVDTRIMTQALRGAVNQAEHLGVAQKQAKDVAVGVGKILSGAPEFIRIPAGFDLVYQLLGKDSDKILKTLDVGTRKQVVGIQQALRAGRLDYYVGAKALMDLIGQTDIGIEAQSKHLEATILKSGPQAAEHIAEQYGIENRATAVMVTQMMQDAVLLKKELAASGMTFATALVKDTGMINSALETMRGADKKAAETAKKNLEQMGLNPDQIKEYAAVYDQTMKDVDTVKLTARDKELNALIDAAQKQGKRDIASIQEKEKIRLELFKKTTAVQTKFLKDQLNPVEALMDKIEKKAPSPKGGWMIDTQLDRGALVAAGITSSKELAKTLGGTYEDMDKETRKKLDDVFTGAGTITRDGLREVRSSISKANTDAKAAADARQASLLSFIDTPLTWIKSKLVDYWGPTGTIIAGMGLMVAGVWALIKGQKALLNWGIRQLETPMYLNVYKALKAAGVGRRLGPGGGEGGGGTTTTTKRSPEDIKKERDKNKEDRRKREVEGETKEERKKRLKEEQKGKASPEGSPRAEREKLRRETETMRKEEIEHKKKTSMWSKTKGAGSKIKAGGKTALGALVTGMVSQLDFGEVGNKLVEAATTVTDIASEALETKAMTSTATEAAKGLGKGALFKETFKAASKTKLPGIGTVISAGMAGMDVYEAVKEGKTGKDLAKTVGKAGGGLIGGAGGAWAGAAGGAATGALIGSVVPGIGTAIGALVGGIIGSIGGGYAGTEVGEYIGEKAVDAFVSEDKIGAPKMSAVAGTPTTLPTEKPVIQPARRGVGNLGGTPGMLGLTGEVGMQSLTPDGALTIKVRGFNEVIAMINKNMRELA